ncbi:MAG: hypothetical protein CSA72_09215 [Rhodobacterales bacterium]|nr:MAG: hypothetical protein CSA72_09215 [Rhodobacterales bacterium]
MTSSGSERRTDKVTSVDVIAVALSVVWLLMAAIFFLTLPRDPDAETDPLRVVIVMLAVFMPVAMIWVAAAAAKAARIMRAESVRLHAAIDGMREVVLADRKERVSATQSGPVVEKTLKEIAHTARQTENVLATFSTTRKAPSKPALPAPSGGEATDQPALALGTRAEDMQPPLANGDLVRALNFPDSAEDEAGFAALRRALAHREPAKLIQASQDVLTLLSQDGIYMDDLNPDRARPEYWRRFAQGERGGAVAALGGVRDRSCLAMTAGRMREDTIFRDAAHHFLRMFDQLLEKFEPEASDEELAALAETRTARAFMLLGRVTGAFD